MSGPDRERAVVAVELAPESPDADAIGAAAVALGVDIDVRAPSTARTRIGDVALPKDPEAWMIEAALLRALRPGHVLFLCVANSARSQLAEGLGRALAPDHVIVSSAGSAPTSVRPQAVAVLAEVGIDIADYRSTGIDEVDRTVDAVITLCAEEVCPVWLGQAWRLHWGLPDPAGVGGSERRKREAFRSVRDELTRRLTLLFEGQLPTTVPHLGPGSRRR